MVFFNKTNLEKKLIFFFGFCISSIGTIKIQVHFFNYPLYLLFTFLLTFFFIFKLIIEKKIFLFLSKFNNKYFFFIIFIFILLFLLTLNLGVKYIRIKPIILFTLFYFILQNTYKRDKDDGVKSLIFGLIFGAIFNCFFAFLQKVGFEPINNLREFLIIEKLKPNDFTDGGWLLAKTPPGFSVTSVQFSYILSSLNIITLYYIFFEKVFKKNSSLKFLFIYFLLCSYSLLTFSKYLIVTNLLFFIFFYFWKNKINLNKIIFLLVLISIVLFINMKNLNNFNTKINEAFDDRKLLIKTSFLFLEKFPYGLKLKEVGKEKEIIVENNFTNIRDKNYILTTAPHNFILTSSYYSGYLVFFIQTFFVIFIVLFGFKSIVLNNKNRFLKTLYFATLNNFGYGMFHNSGIFNGDFFITLILTIIIFKLDFIKTYKND